MFKYVVTGDRAMAVVVHSGLGLEEFKDVIRTQSVKLHPKGSEYMWKTGLVELVNPKVYTGDDYISGGHCCPRLIGVQ
jgi:hypothetical protein